MHKGKVLVSLLILIFLLSGFYSYNTLDFSPKKQVLSKGDLTSQTSKGSSEQIVAKVIDGDTIQLTSGEKVRLIGIDTPEAVDPRRGVQCFGKKASEFTKKILLNKKVTLRKDVSETDKYGRLLRYVYVDDIFINELLVKEGYAKATSYPPDVMYQSLFQSTQEEAQRNNRGLWKECLNK